MSDCDNMCTECDSNPKMAVPKKMRTDYGMMVTANILMTVSIDSLGRKNDQLEAENAELRTQLADVTESMGRVEERCAKLRELCADLYAGMLAYSKVQPTTQAYWATRLGELGIEVDG